MMYLLFAAAMAVMAYGFYRHFRLWSLGRPELRSGSAAVRLRFVLQHVLGQGRLLRERYAGLFHALFFWGFIVLFLGTVVVMIDTDLHIPIMHGEFYLYFQSLALDIFGLLTTVGILMAAVKRYGQRPERLMTSHNRADGLILAWIFVILVTGFLIEGLRIVVTRDPWGAWSPVGLATGRFLAALGLTPPAMVGLHAGLWWFHLVLVLGFLAYIPYSKLLHLVTAPLNTFLVSLEPKGALRPIDVETAETLGTPRIQDFSWKHLLDLDACTECGRCQAVCPAYAVGKPLNPKAIVLDLRDYLHAQGPLLLAGDGDGSSSDDGSPIIGPVISEEALWACVTCRACMEACPVFIEHVPKIVDMRRYLVMEQAEFPETMQEAIRSLEARGHPFRGATASRTDWYEGLDILEMSQAKPEEVEVLYWVGCAAAFDERNQKVARAFSQVMKRAGVRFAILGPEERCTGDPARRIGNEYLYQMMAQQNVETLNSYNVKTIVTTCAHCFNTIKNEYPQFGGHYDVVHHTEFIERLIQEGRLTPNRELKALITYHDPCYLGRYNDVYDEPRTVLRVLPGAQVVEMKRCRNN
ncbi:MAG: 4Fe-4S dicluster domain-containing protein, partial [Clostridia bacterium]|nr:4Fe-4S dicluster domain-containing protein [Clostridia bacterium]